MRTSRVVPAEPATVDGPPRSVDRPASPEAASEARGAAAPVAREKRWHRPRKGTRARASLERDALGYFRSASQAGSRVIATRQVARAPRIATRPIERSPE